MVQLKHAWCYIKTLLKWLIVSTIVGLVGGVVGSVFHLSIDYVTELRTQQSWILFLLPLGGLFIAAIYAIFRSKGRLDTNRVLDAVYAEEKVPLIMAPLIFLSTVVTHLFGGSAGREGAALQLGGSIGYNVGKVARLNKTDMHTIIMSGMSSVFAALFGTPLTAAVFAIEVVRVGVMHYAALVPCIVSSTVAFLVAQEFGVTAVRFEGVILESVSAGVVGKIIVLAILCAMVSILFCTAIKLCSGYAKKLLPNQYLRAFVGGCLIIGLTVLLGTTDYNGAGMNVIERAIAGEARYEAFLLKILFTAITIAVGFKGGEIVPAFFVGATFGCAFGSIVGIDPGFAAALGFVAMFCGVVNCPLCSIILAVEVFGTQHIMLFALVCAISYMMSGYFGLYESQHITYSKLDEAYIDMKTK